MATGDIQAHRHVLPWGNLQANRLKVAGIGFLTGFAIGALELVGKLSITNMLTQIKLVSGQGKCRAILQLPSTIGALEGKGWLSLGTTVAELGCVCICDDSASVDGCDIGLQ